MKFENMAEANEQTMHKLGYYWGGCHYDESRPCRIGVETVGGFAFLVVAGYTGDDGEGWFAEAYDLFETEETAGTTLSEDGPQDAINELVKLLGDVSARWADNIQ